MQYCFGTSVFSTIMHLNVIAKFFEVILKRTDKLCSYKPEKYAQSYSKWFKPMITLLIAGYFVISYCVINVNQSLYSNVYFILGNLLIVFATIVVPILMTYSIKQVYALYLNQNKRESY